MLNLAAKYPDTCLVLFNVIMHLQNVIMSLCNAARRGIAA